jgi:hypothetical protein
MSEKDDANRLSWAPKEFGGSRSKKKCARNKRTKSVCGSLSGSLQLGRSDNTPWVFKCDVRIIASPACLYSAHRHFRSKSFGRAPGNFGRVPGIVSSLFLY